MEQTSLPFEDLFRNSWQYHFDNVLSRFHLLINIASDSIQIIKYSLFITIIKAKCSFLFALRIILSALGIESF
jgi:hypothetical protein